MYWDKPEGFEMGTDSLNWAVVLPQGSVGMRIRAVSNDVVLSTVGVGSGLNYGAPDEVKVGEQRLELLDAAGDIVMSAIGGRRVEVDCPDGIYNMNYQVVGMAHGDNTVIGRASIGGGTLSSGGK